MRKIGVLVFILFFVSLAIAETGFELHNISIIQSYPMGRPLQGQMNFTITDFDLSIPITSNRDHSAPIQFLLDELGATYDCIPHNCTSTYRSVNSSDKVSVVFGSGDKTTYGFYLEGEEVSVTKIDFKIASNFTESKIPPLSFDFLEDPENRWRFSNYSSGSYYDRDYGYYNILGSTTSPLANWTYCQKLYIYQTTDLMAGADLVTGDSDGFVKIIIYEPITGAEEAVGYFNPKRVGNVRFLRPLENPVTFGEYDVCIRAHNGSSSNYLVGRNGGSGNQNGFSFRGAAHDSNASFSPPVASYSIWIKEGLYNGAYFLTNYANFSENFGVSQVNNYLRWKYNYDCTDGCFLPFSFWGILQNLTLFNATLEYDTKQVPVIDRSAAFHKLYTVAPVANYSGELDLGALDFTMNRTGVFKLFVGNENLDSWQVKINDAPTIKGIYPNTVPAGINAALFVDLDYNASDRDLTFVWDFGDQTTATTTEPKVLHKYANMSRYLVKVTVKDGNVTNSESKYITTVNPKQYVWLIHQQMSISLNESLGDLESFPQWQQPILKQALGITASQDELRRIKRLMNEAVDDDDYLAIAAAVNNLDLPRKVFISENYNYDLSTTDDPNIDAFAAWTEESYPSGKVHDDAVDAVARWMDVNADFSVSVKKISLLKTSGVVQPIMLVYYLSFKNNFGDDAYLVLESSRDTLKFNGLEKEPISKDGVVIFKEIPSEGTLNLEFFKTGTDEVEFFATSLIEYLVFEAEINENCNFNLICEKATEDYKTCRSDCKPVGLMILYIVLIAIGMLVLYTVIQIWYDKHYEGLLFKDKNRLYNLLMFVTAAKNKGMSREEIKKSLREKGWTSERVEFVVKKANGERVGLYEIIPISKLMASSREKTVKANPGMASSIPSPSGPPVARVRPVPGRGPSGRGPPGRGPPGRGPPGRGPPGRGPPGRGPPGKPGPHSSPSKKPGSPPGGGATPPKQQSGGNVNKGKSQSSSKTK